MPCARSPRGASWRKPLLSLLLLALAVTVAAEDATENAGDTVTEERHEELDSLEEAFPRPEVEADAPPPAAQQPTQETEGENPAQNEGAPTAADNAATDPSYTDDSSVPRSNMGSETTPPTPKSKPTARSAPSRGSKWEPVRKENDYRYSRYHDDYYSFRRSPVNNLYPMAFQPDNILTFEIPPWDGSWSAAKIPMTTQVPRYQITIIYPSASPSAGATVSPSASPSPPPDRGEGPGVLEFYLDVDVSQIGRALRGTWYTVGTGSEDGSMAVACTILDSEGQEVYNEGPFEEDKPGEEVSQGSFAFQFHRPGVWTIRFSNPSSEGSRKVSFGMLVGKDGDDPWTGRNYDDYDYDWDSSSAWKPAVSASPGALAEDGQPPPTPPSPSPSPTPPTAIEKFMRKMFKKVSKVHKKVDDIISQQQFADVRFARHMTLSSTLGKRINWWFGVETGVVLLVGIGQIIVIRRFFENKAGVAGNPRQLV